MLEHRLSLADRDDRTRDQDTAGADRLSEVAVLLCQPSRFVDRALERASDVRGQVDAYIANDGAYYSPGGPKLFAATYEGVATATP